eukprot:1158933-Pelagomonas_calceolata.AAC.2
MDSTVSQSAPSKSGNIGHVGQHLGCDIGRRKVFVHCMLANKPSADLVRSTLRSMLGQHLGMCSGRQGRSGCDAMSLPASACTPVTTGHPTSMLSLCPPLQNLTPQYEWTTSE